LDKHGNHIWTAAACRRSAAAASRGRESGAKAPHSKGNPIRLLARSADMRLMLAVSLLSISAYGHDFLIEPSTFRPAVGQSVIDNFSSAGFFIGSQFAPNAPFASGATTFRILFDQMRVAQ
jgi:hypothetical protein